MSNIFKKSYDVTDPKSAHVKSEFGLGKAGLLLCENCKAVYYKKRWHKDIESLNRSEAENLSKSDSQIKVALCPACTMVKNGQFEGRILLESVPVEKGVELEGLIRGFSRRGEERDPMDRLINIKKEGNKWEVTVTENQLANKLADKIKETFHTVKKETRFSPEPSDVAYITMEFGQNGEDVK